MDRGGWIQSGIIGGSLLLALVACDPGRVTEPALRVSPPAQVEDRPVLGPVQSYTDDAARSMFVSMLEHQLSGSVAQRNAVTPGSRPSARETKLAARLSQLRSSELLAVEAEPADSEALYFVRAETDVEITDGGRGSTAEVGAISEMNRAVVISHDIVIRLTTLAGTTTFPAVHDGTGVWKRSSLATYTPLRGVNCTTRSRVSAETTHRAGGWLDREITAFSVDDDSCGGDEACESSDEPPTAVAPGPYDPGYGGDGSTGTTGGCDGTGGTTPPSSNCHDEYVYVERSTDGGVTWTVIWEGWSIVCE
jgi:hypothetical protein